MTQQGHSPKIIRFGVFEVDLTAAELRKQGLRLRLQEQPFQVLAALLENPGEVISREDLIRRLWPDGMVVDFDRGLNAAVTRLRQVLSDSAETPRYVETVARRGYRFIAPVETAGEVASGPLPVAKRRLWIWPVVAISAVIGIGSTLWFVRGGNTRAVDGAFHVTPLTTEPGFEGTPSFSPDGSQIAFEWDQGTGQPHIFIKVTGTGDPVRLTSASEAEYGPAWSRDGRQIAFLRKVDSSNMGIFVIPALGGVEHKVAELVVPFWALRSQLRRMDWMPDNQHLILSGAERPGGDERLLLVATNNDVKRWLTIQGQPNSLNGDREPAVSPDGRTVAFIRGKLSIDETLHLVSLSGDLQPVGEPRKLADGNRARNPAWTPDGQEIVFISNGRLARIGLANGAAPRQLSALGTNLMMPAFSQTGRLAFTLSSRDTNIWRQEVPSLSGIMPPPVRLIASTGDDQDAQYSPDGTRIVFQSNRSGTAEIWTCRGDGAHCVQITNFNKSFITGTPRWSPNGMWIAFDSAWEGHFNIYVVNANGGAPRRQTDNSTNTSIPSWSQDGNWIYFASSKTGRSEVWRVPFAGGMPERVTHNGGMTAFELPGGKYLYYTKAEFDKRLWKCALDGGGESEVLNGVAHRGFALTADRIYYLRDEPGGEIAIRRFMMNTREDSRIATMTKPTYLGLSLSPDGRYLIYSQVDQEGADLMLVNNFR